MERVSHHHVDLVRARIRENRPQCDQLEEVYIVSINIISSILGFNWTKNISDEILHGGGKRGLKYLRTTMKTSQERYEHQDRFVDLADSLFLLQSCEGFSGKIEKLREISPANPKVILEDTAIELYIVKMLLRRGCRVRFISPTGKKKEDFDLQVTIPSGKTVNAEIKCKRENTVVTINSLRNTLRDARAQLPKSNPSMVFTRLPTGWVEDVKFISKVDDVLRGFFRNASRVNAVIFVWEEWIDVGQGCKAVLKKYRPNFNPSPNFTIEGLDALFQGSRSIPDSEGVFLKLSFGDFIG